MFVIQQLDFEMVADSMIVQFVCDLDSAAEDGESEQNGKPAFTLHIGMLYTAICRLVWKHVTKKFHVAVVCLLWCSSLAFK